MRTRSPSLLLIPLVLVALGACASNAGPPPAPPGVDPAHLHFSKAAVHQGEPAPDFTLRTNDALTSVTLSDWRGKPVVLVFGSYT